MSPKKSGLFTGFENLLSVVAGLALFAIMLLVAFDVAMRYLFNHPLALVNEVVSLYLLATLFFLSLSSTSRTRGHISVDIIKNRLGSTARRLAEAFGAFVGLVLFGGIGGLGLLRTLESYQNDDRLLGVVAWPVWTAELVVPLGCAALCIRLTITVAGHLMSAATGTDVIPEPPTDAEQESIE